MRIHDVKLFCHRASHKEFVAEASEVPPTDEITILNPRTGGMVTFRTMLITKDIEGDIVRWTYSPSRIDVKHFPKLAGYTLKIFND